MHPTSLLSFQCTTIMSISAFSLALSKVFFSDKLAAFKLRKGFQTKIIRHNCDFLIMPRPYCCGHTEKAWHFYFFVFMRFAVVFCIWWTRPALLAWNTVVYIFSHILHDVLSYCCMYLLCVEWTHPWNHLRLPCSLPYNLNNRTWIRNSNSAGSSGQEFDIC